MAGISIASLVAEFLGTFLLVFTVGCNVIGNQGAFGGVSIACVLMVSIYALGGVSGANFNPAVSFALGLAGKMQDGWKQVAAYIFVQIAGGTVAACSYCLLFKHEVTLKDSRPSPSGGNEKFGLYSILVCEFYYTFMLVFAVLNTAASKKLGGKNQFYGLTIAFSIVAGAYGAGAVSGGCFNPAVAIGIDISSADTGFGFSIAYAGIELLAAAVAVGVFWTVRPDERDPDGAMPDEASLLVPKLVCEFFGTFMLVLTVGLNVLAKSPAGAFSIAAALMVMINSTGDISGGHYNPAVTIAILCSKRDKISPFNAALYILTQTLGGIVAGLTYGSIYSQDKLNIYPDIPKTIGFGQIAFAEIVFTFVLAFVVLCVATVRNAPAPEYIGFIIASCVTVGGNAVGSISGGHLNPAVSIGVATPAGLAAFGPAAFYAGMQIIGGAAAAGVFLVTHANEYEDAGVTEKLLAQKLPEKYDD